jgi:hypothetical protein
MLTNALRRDASGELERMSLRSSRGGEFSQVLSAADQKHQGRLIGIDCRRRGASRCSVSATGTDGRKRGTFAAIPKRGRALDYLSS